MSIVYNGTALNTIKYNGVTLTKIMFNNTVVYNKNSLILPPQVSMIIEDAERKGYAQVYLDCYNPNDFAVNIIVESLKVGSVSKNRDLTINVTFYDASAGGGKDRVGALSSAQNAMLVYNNINELAVPYGGCLTVHFQADDGRVSNSITVLHDDWNSTAT